MLPSTLRFQVVALKFKGTSLAPRVCARKQSCARPSPVSRGTPHTRLLSLGVLRMPVSCLSGYTHSCILSRWEPAKSVAAETGGGVNFENDPCCNVMNQEAGILHQLFMQIFGCSLSSSTWKEWVLKTRLHCRALINPIPPPEWSLCRPPQVISRRYVYNILCDIISLVMGSLSTLLQEYKESLLSLDFKQCKIPQSMIYKGTSSV